MDRGAAIASQLPRAFVLHAVRVAVIVASIARPAPVDAKDVQRPDLILVVVDALRPDRLGCYGAARDVSPAIDAVAAQGVVYRDAFAVSSWTKPSIPSLLTSLYPLRHGVFEGVYQSEAGETLTDLLAESLVTVPEALRDAGYETAAFVQNAQLLARWGFDQGFARYDEEAGDARAIVDSCLAWFDSGGGRPRFVYLHFLDAHWPYRPLDAHRRRFGASALHDSIAGGDWRALRDAINDGRKTPSAAERQALLDLYDACIYGVDAEIGRLVDGLEARGAWDGAAVIITADHGEEFMEHAQFGHGENLYDECLRIPMIVKPAGAASAGAVDEIVSTLDVAPTLLAAAGVPAPGAFEGRPMSALGAPSRASKGTAAAASAPLFAEVKHKRVYSVAARDGAWKYIARYEFDSNRKDPELAKHLAPGTWVEIELDREEGGLEADEIKVIGSGNGVRAKVTGQIEAVARAGTGASTASGPAGAPAATSPAPSASASAPPAALQILGRFFPVESEARIEWEGAEGGASADPSALSAGLWIDAKGDVEKGLFAVEKIEVNAKSGFEVRGPVESMERTESGDFRVQILGLGIDVPADVAVEHESAAAARASVVSASPARPSVAALFAHHPFERTEELYDWRRDSGERANLAAANPETLATLRARVERWLDERGIDTASASRASAAATAPGESSGTAPLDDETIEKLRALGYIR